MGRSPTPGTPPAGVLIPTGTRVYSTLAGVATMLQESIGVGDYYPIGDEYKARVVQSAREELGEEAFDQNWRVGRSLSHEEAVQLARSTLD